MAHHLARLVLEYAPDAEYGPFFGEVRRTWNSPEHRPLTRLRYWLTPVGHQGHEAVISDPPVCGEPEEYHVRLDYEAFVAAFRHHDVLVLEKKLPDTPTKRPA